MMSAPKPSRRLILNADDLGYDPEVSRGIVEALDAGVVSSATLMVNTPYAESSVGGARGFGVGLHLNLCRWNAVSKSTLELNERDVPTYTSDFVEEETLAQFERAGTLLQQRPTHIDVHKHMHSLPHVLEGVIRAAKQIHCPVRSITPQMRDQLIAAKVHTNTAFLGEAAHEAYWTVERFFSVLASAPSDGVVELMCHPGYSPSHVKSGYADQRTIELTTFTARETRERLKALGIRFLSWAGV